MKIIITSHAVNRFTKRIAPYMSFLRAKNYLYRKAESTKPLKNKTVKGTTQWLLQQPQCVLVIKHDHLLKSFVCVTILTIEEANIYSENDPWS
jgi:hypothetical protein